MRKEEENYGKNASYHHIWCNRVGWWISKVGVHGVKWKLLGIEIAVVKGFFSKISILGDKWLLKIAKKNEKMRFSLQWAGIRKSYTI